MSKLLLPVFLIFCFTTTAQVKSDTLTGKAAQDLIDSLKIDNSTFLKSSRDAACTCIGKIKTKKKTNEKVSGEIKKCIDDEITSYQMMTKLLGSMKGMNEGKDQTININVNKESSEYQKYYFEIERELRDSCESVKTILGSNEEQSKHSVSKNDDAIAYYTIGQDAMKKENYEDAVKYFLKAVNKDPKFAFAWDNLGVSYRKMEKYQDAVDAYNKSLALDPKGTTPLQNLPLVYQFLKEYDKSIESYKKLIEIYPNNPEGYYGVGQTYIYLKDYENALNYMCQAYNLYIKIGSPYRTDAEANIQLLYSELKKQGKEESFNRILKENHINPTKSN